MATTGFSPVNVGILPGRKLPSLYEIDNGVIRELATFKSRETMERFLSFNPRVEQAKLIAPSEGGDE